MTNGTDIHEKFRIWITTESSPKFPISNFFLIPQIESHNLI